MDNDYNIKSITKKIRKDFKSKGVFYTSKNLAEYLKSFLPDDVEEVYDPTCGNGALLSVFGDDVQKYGQDINAEQVHEADRILTNFHGVVGDTLKEPAFWGKKFKYIIANPPFSIKWEPKVDERFDGFPCLPPPSKSDYAFLGHILYYLSDDGMAVVLNSPGILFRDGSEGNIRRWMVKQNYIDCVIDVEGGSFVDTSISTAILILRKNKALSNITFIKNEIKKSIAFEEIEKNNFILNPSTYIQERQTEEIPPPDKLIMEYQEKRNQLNVEMDCILNQIMNILAGR